MKNDITKYFVVDLYAHGAEHSLFIEAFVDFFEKKDCVFLLNDVHEKFLKNDRKNNIGFLLKDSKIKNKYLRLFNREAIKLLWFLLLVPYILITRRKVCVLGVSNLQLFFLSFFSYLKPSIVMHGQAEALITNSENLSKASKLFKYGFDKLTKAGIKFLFLSKHIEKNIISTGNYFYIKHPLPSNKILKTPKELQDNPLKLAMVGLLRNDKKNCNLIYDLSLNGTTEIWAIGRAHKDFIVNYDSKVKFKLWDSVYSDVEFEKAIAEIDGFIYLFDESQYKMTASATALDAIIHQKLVFTLKNDAVQSLLESYPHVVYAENIDDLSSIIDSFEPRKIVIDNAVILKNYVLGGESIDTKIVEEWIQ
ncbi:hypothetical protein ACQ7NX_02200 [Enterobacter cloacae subsp. dissolvens]|uniref:hypothetical protein n=1 Tax=Enterobacter cloacae TaxID=550 RepID=UPI0007B321FC|nr:hypothetical protein [Enterobacter cloacae]KZP67944.1 hypothetical protein A3N40_17810 [Enterobacter cloacae subsp. dissolvens]